MYLFASSAGTGTITLLFLYPIDLVRLRIMADVGVDGNARIREFNGFRDCF